uniref:Uncharacterized protein n=1 Tax=Burkholderia sp. (strain CCGE1003) TaxID=640512 RepID=E1TDK9_BURSG
MLPEATGRSANSAGGAEMPRLHSDKGVHTLSGVRIYAR